MNNYRLLLIILTFCVSNNLNAQSTPEWVIQAEVNANKIHISWFPTDPSTWKEGLRSGYTLTRETIGGSSSSLSPVRIMPRATSWFNSLDKDQSGVLYPVGRILYDDDFINSSGKQNDELQFNYVVFESSISTEVAEATGLGYVDSVVTSGSTYRYTIRHNSSGKTISLTVNCKEGERLQEPGGYLHKFTFPDGNSLSDMLERSKPFVINAILGKARPKIDSVILRWVPTNVNIFKTALTDGYEIWRSNGVEAPKLIATVMPWTEAQIRQMPRADTLAMLGAAFVMDKGMPQGIDQANMLDRSMMEKNYFGFALTAADRSPLAADVMGLRYVDRDVKFAETYKYEIRTRRLTSDFPVPDIWVTNEFEPLAPPENFRTEKKDRAVVLKWMPGSNVQYSSFIIERMNPGDTLYHPLSTEPMVFIRARELQGQELSFIDSLPANNVNYYYRIKGSNAFGEWSDYAYNHGYGRDMSPPEAVTVVSGKFRKETSDIRVSWTRNTKDKDIKYHQIMVSDHPEFNFSSISGELPPGDTAFILSLKEMDIDRSFYFQINTVDSSGNMATSEARYVFVPDHDRPEPPAKIKASVTKEGWLTVTWSPSVSKDVTGYYVFYSNTEPNDLALVFSKPIKDTTYSWQLDMKSLTKNIYISAKAEDDNYNRSFLAEIQVVRRPDTIPPTAPYLEQAVVKKDMVEIQWQKSSSRDVVKYLVYFKNQADSLAAWTLLDSVAVDTLKYVTPAAFSDAQLQFAVKAADDFNNQSTYSNPGQVYIPFPGFKFTPMIQKLSKGKDLSVTLNWESDLKKLQQEGKKYSYQLFRSAGSSDVTLFRELTSAETSFVDNNVEAGVMYNYALRVKFEDGKTSDLSTIKSLLVK